MEDTKIQPFDSFSKVYEVLVLTGYCKPINRSKNRLKRICHQIYRRIAFVAVIVLNITHIIYIIQRRHYIDKVFDCSMLEIPQANLIVKLLTVNLQTSRIDKMNKLLNDPIFAAYSKKDEELLLQNKRNMHRLCRIFIIFSISIIGVCWLASHFVRRYQDPTVEVASYIPFKTDTWSRFAWSVMCEVLPMLWVGYGHLALDCVVVTYYSAAEVQLKIIKYNLEHLFDADPTDRVYGNQYRDIVDKDLKNRFVHYVQRYETLVWFTKEIGNIFNTSMSIQLYTSTAAICLVIYKMSFINMMSIEFVFLTVLLLTMLTQVFLYCYYGNLVQYESQSVMTSIYLSDWQTVSPQFRRILLIAMLRWSRTLTPRVSGIVPLSLNTYVSVKQSFVPYVLFITGSVVSNAHIYNWDFILKTAYSLYAVLTANRN